MLADFAAGKVPADRAAQAAVTAYYAGSPAVRAALRPVVEVIERTAPGVVELASTGGGSGFALRPVQRPFPGDAEAALRSAAQAALAQAWSVAPAAAGQSGGGLMQRLVARMRRLFSSAS